MQTLNIYLPSCFPNTNLKQIQTCLLVQLANHRIETPGIYLPVLLFHVYCFNFNADTSPMNCTKYDKIQTPLSMFASYTCLVIMCITYSRYKYIYATFLVIDFINYGLLKHNG